MPIDIVADIEAEIGDPIVTRHLASLSGYYLLQRPECAGGFADLVQAAGASMKEHSETITELGKAMSDGAITPDEAATVRKEGNEAIQAILAMMDAVDAKVEAVE